MAPPSGSNEGPEFVPKLPRENPNISNRPPLKEFAFVASIVLGATFLLYLILGALAGWAATHLPAQIELRVGESLRILDTLDESESPDRERLQALVAGLAEHAPATELPLKVHLIESGDVNAVTLIGGHILVFRGLLDEARSENEIAMILGHELGHIVHRDHLRALGRRLVLSTALASMGIDGLASRLLEGGISTLELGFSREQEHAADRLGLDLLAAHYGHVGGATDFFERRVADERLPELFSTHPLSRERIQRIERLGVDAGYRIGELTAW